MGLAQMLGRDVASPFPLEGPKVGPQTRGPNLEGECGGPQQAHTGGTETTPKKGPCGDLDTWGHLNCGALECVTGAT